MKHNIALIVSYDGTAYSGFQSQPNQTTIQGKLTAAIESITNHEVILHGSGRTDAGVHSHGQVVSFQTNRLLAEERWPFALNGFLPDDIRVRRAIEVPQDFHARYSVVEKTYRYYVTNSSVPNVLLRHMQYHFPRTFDEIEMRRAAQVLEGTHDFRAFCAKRSLKENNVRTIYNCDIHKIENGYCFELRGNGFLHNMVRIIVGTLLRVAEGKKSAEWVREVLENGNRTSAAPTVPAYGLQLWSVKYDLFNSE